ncbi:large ribosomal subunit protein uL23-like [Callorhinus ursinus]|uniref:large ribosomal subunit protein uL23-like n=1 Tax=Callorhinus ursinus TaxID=34884 RepID=UPI003CD01725
MVLKANTEGWPCNAPAPSKAEAKAKALKAHKAALEGVCSNTTNRRPHVTHLLAGQGTAAQRSLKERSREKRARLLRPEIPLDPRVATETEGSNLVFTGDVQAKEHPVMQPVKRF